MHRPASAHSVRQESELLDKENVPGAGRTLEGKDQDLDGMCCQPVSGSGDRKSVV